MLTFSNTISIWDWSLIRGQISDKGASRLIRAVRDLTYMTLQKIGKCHFTEREASGNRGSCNKREAEQGNVPGSGVKHDINVNWGSSMWSLPTAYNSIAVVVATGSRKPRTTRSWFESRLKHMPGHEFTLHILALSDRWIEAVLAKNRGEWFGEPTKGATKCWQYVQESASRRSLPVNPHAFLGGQRCQRRRPCRTWMYMVYIDISWYQFHSICKEPQSVGKFVAFPGFRVCLMQPEPHWCELQSSELLNSEVKWWQNFQNSQGRLSTF